MLKPAAAPLRLTGAQALVRVLLAEGVDTVFGIVGGKLSPLFHALSREPRIRFIGVRHEAAGADDGRGGARRHRPDGGGRRASWGPAASTSHPGSASPSTTTCRCWRSRPTSIAPSSYPHVGVFMDLDTRAVTAPAHQVECRGRTTRAACPSWRAARSARRCSGRPGPVHLDIPQDVLGEVHAFAADEFDAAAVALSRDARRRAPPRPRCRRRWQLLRARPAAARRRRRRRRRSGAAAPFASWRAASRAPVVPTQMALGVVPSDSAHFIGHGGLIAGDAVKHAFERADVIVSIGCRWSSWMWDERGAVRAPPSPAGQHQHRSVGARRSGAARSRDAGRRRRGPARPARRAAASTALAAEPGLAGRSPRRCARATKRSSP